MQAQDQMLPSQHAAKASHKEAGLLTLPVRACIALTGVQPGFSAECRVLAGTATTPPAVNLLQPVLFSALKMAHPTSSPAAMASWQMLKICSSQTQSIKLEINVQMQPANKAENRSYSWNQHYCISTFHDVSHFTQVWMQHWQPNPCTEVYTSGCFKAGAVNGQV